MTFIEEEWKSGLRAAAAAHERHVNPQMPRVLRIIGFDKSYVKASGMTLWDEEGNTYLDFLAGYSVFSLGHNPPELIQTLQETLAQDWPSLLQMVNPPLSARLAEALCRRDPSGRLRYAYFGNSGSESVECALKFARAATGRPRLLSFEGAFHGLTLGALSVCGDNSWKERFGPLLPGCAAIPYGDLDRLEAELRSRDVAGFIVEPVQGEGGVRELSQAQWDRVQALCRRFGTLLILDEVQSGFGRTGRFFAFEHWGLEPDLVCLSKAITNGLVPASATLGTEDVFRAVFNRLDRCVVHSSTFGENNLAMAAALRVLEQLDAQDLARRAQERGRYLRERLQASVGDSEFVKEIRGRGLMTAIEFGAPSSLKLKLAWNLLAAADKGLFGQMVATALLNRHRMLTQVAGHDLNVLKLSPPLIVSEAQIDAFASALAMVLEDCERFPGGLWDFGLDLAKRALSIVPAGAAETAGAASA